MNFLLTISLLVGFASDSVSDSHLFISPSECELNGNWRLIALKVTDQIMSIDTTRYFLKVSEKGFEYNLNVNTCKILEWEIKGNELKVIDTSCTRICCDDSEGKTYEYIDYSGTYVMDDSCETLQITSSNGISELTLKKIAGE